MKHIESEKVLGVIINEDLKTHEQCVEVSNKANKILNMLRRHIECKSPEIITNMYNSYI